MKKRLVTWLFKTRLTNRQFHLHDIAGAAKSEKTRKKSYERRQRNFERQYGEWHTEVRQLMAEAGTFSEKLPAFLKWSIVLILAATIAFSSYADGGGAWEIAFPFIVARSCFTCVDGAHTNYGCRLFTSSSCLSLRLKWWMQNC